ncbi:MAG: hypothetical protein F6K04_23665, partial [Leptolyngbya sp. SIO4C5]|nr:hypothetical protein [Leptolyngbya sp. SIO4C5]
GERLGVEVVRRLVEEEDVGAGLEHAGEMHAALEDALEDFAGCAVGFERLRCPMKSFCNGVTYLK